MFLQAKDLVKNFGALHAVKNVSLDVGPGVHSIIGPNGAGKTTLFNLLTGFLTVDSGQILFQKENIAHLPPYKISQLGIARTFQIRSFFPDLTVYENIRLGVQSRLKSSYNFFMSYRKLNNVHQKTESILKQIGLEEVSNFTAKNLPYGLQTSLDIGICLASDPKLILLDEPTSGTDQKDTEAIIELIPSISKKVPVLLIEHNIDMVLSISDIVTVLFQGRVLAEGTPSEIQNNEKVQQAYLGGY